MSGCLLKNITKVWFINHSWALSTTFILNLPDVVSDETEDTFFKSYRESQQILLAQNEACLTIQDYSNTFLVNNVKPQSI